MNQVISAVAGTSTPRAKAGHVQSQLMYGRPQEVAQEVPDFVRIEVDSDTMSPTFVRGESLVVEIGLRPESCGSGLYVFRYPGRSSLVVRRVFISWDLQAQLIPDNSAYATEKISLPALGEIPCLGRVVTNKL